MNNTEKLILIRENLFNSKMQMDEAGLKTALKHIASFIYDVSNIPDSSVTKTTPEFDATFPDVKTLFYACNSALNDSIIGTALFTRSKLNLDASLLGQGKFEDVFFETCSDTGDWHSHKRHWEITRSFTVHFPIWIKDDSIELADIEYEVDVIEDYSNVTNNTYESAKVVANELFDAGKAIRVKCKNFTFLDFRSSLLHRGYVPEDVILCSIVFNYPSKSTDPEIINFLDFKTNLTLDECINLLPSVGKRCLTELCGQPNY